MLLSANQRILSVAMTSYRPPTLRPTRSAVPAGSSPVANSWIYKCDDGQPSNVNKLPCARLICYDSVVVYTAENKRNINTLLILHGIVALSFPNLFVNICMHWFKCKVLIIKCVVFCKSEIVVI